MSVRDLELVLCHDLDGLSRWADNHRRRTHGDLLLLKVVLATGLYPQIAVPDLANAYRVANKGGAAGPGVEMVFHTPVGHPTSHPQRNVNCDEANFLPYLFVVQTKAFVALQPNDVFVKQPDRLFSHNNSESEHSEAVPPSLPTSTSHPHRPTHKAVGSQFAPDHQLLIYQWVSIVLLAF